MLDASVDGEYSYLQTLRHLVFAIDRWITGPVLGLADNQGTAWLGWLSFVAAVGNLRTAPHPGSSVEFKGQTEGVVDGLKFIEIDAANKFAEAFRSYRRRLFHEHQCFLAIQRDGRTKEAARRRSGCRSNKQGGQHEVVSLNDHGESCTSLFAASGVARCTKTMNVTTHEVRPSRPKPVGFRLGLSRRS